MLVFRSPEREALLMSKPVLITALSDYQLRHAWCWIAEESYWGAQIPWATFERA
jgi:hypothetical protein